MPREIIRPPKSGEPITEGWVGKVTGAANRLSMIGGGQNMIALGTGVFPRRGPRSLIARPIPVQITECSDFDTGVYSYRPLSEILDEDGDGTGVMEYTPGTGASGPAYELSRFRFTPQGVATWMHTIDDTKWFSWHDQWILAELSSDWMPGESTTNAIAYIWNKSTCSFVSSGETVGLRELWDHPDTIPSGTMVTARRIFCLGDDFSLFGDLYVVMTTECV